MTQTPYLAGFGSNLQPFSAAERARTDDEPSTTSSGFVHEGLFYLSDKQLMVFKDKEAILLLDGIIYEYEQRPFSECRARILADHFRRNGSTVFRELRGEFSLCFIDIREKRCLIGLSESGAAALFYRLDNQVLHFGNHLAGFAGACRSGPDLHRIYELISGIGLGSGRTAYRGVSRLLPGHYLEFRQGVLKRDCYSPLYMSVRRPWQGDAYAAFRQTFEESVRRRLDPASTGIALSSGLDSTAVSAVAACVADSDRAIHGFSYQPKAFSAELRRPPYDETLLLKHFYAQHPRLKAHVVDAAGQTVLESLRSTVKIYGEPVYGASNQFWVQAMHSAMVESGCGTMFTGQGGNFGLSWPPPEWAGKDLPGRLRLIGRMSRKQKHELAYLTPAFMEGIVPDFQLIDTWRPALHAMQPSLLRNSIAYTGFLQKQASLFHGLQVTDPTVDRDLLELYLSLPWRAYHRPDGSRLLVRQGLGDLLPPAVLNSVRRGVQAADIQYRVAQEKKAFIELLGFFNKNKLVTFVFEVDRLRKEWESMNFLSMKRKDLNHLLRIVLCGIFLSDFTD
ncbi:MAG: hypothetical protein CSA96_00340 [Bacteroidetes bacterium]|nr:MAG: hypothetical protein CSA96_00340 [Bacteroidota bacterium]